jgi:hypothetical protein
MEINKKISQGVQVEYSIAAVLIMGIVFVEDIAVFKNTLVRFVVSVILLMNIVATSRDAPSISILCAALLVLIHVTYTKPEVWPAAR